MLTTAEMTLQPFAFSRAEHRGSFCPGAHTSVGIFSDAWHLWSQQLPVRWPQSTHWGAVQGRRVLQNVEDFHRDGILALHCDDKERSPATVGMQHLFLDQTC